MEIGSLKPSKEAIEAALAVDTGIGQGASYDHSRYIYINAVLEAAYKVDFGQEEMSDELKQANKTAEWYFGL